jgi:hypothetical protein
MVNLGDCNALRQRTARPANFAQNAAESETPVPAPSNQATAFSRLTNSSSGKHPRAAPVKWTNMYPAVARKSNLPKDRRPHRTEEETRKGVLQPRIEEGPRHRTADPNMKMTTDNPHNRSNAVPIISKSSGRQWEL